MLKGFRELAYKLILLTSGYKRKEMLDAYGFDYQFSERIKLEKKVEELNKDLDESQKEVKRLNALVSDLEKTPIEFYNAQFS